MKWNEMESNGTEGSRRKRREGREREEEEEGRKKGGDRKTVGERRGDGEKKKKKDDKRCLPNEGGRNEHGRDHGDNGREGASVSTRPQERPQPMGVRHAGCGHKLEQLGGGKEGRRDGGGALDERRHRPRSLDRYRVMIRTRDGRCPFYPNTTPAKGRGRLRNGPVS